MHQWVCASNEAPTGKSVPHKEIHMAEISAQAVKDLRAKTDLPMMETRYAVPRPKYIEVFIDAADMLHWAKWTSPARGFLHRFLSKLPVLPIVDDHVERTRTFYHRFVRLLREHHGEDMEAAKALMEELNGPPSCLPPILRFP